MNYLRGNARQMYGLTASFDISSMAREAAAQLPDLHRLGIYKF